MITEEMKKELEKEGYTIHKKLDERLLKRRSDLYYNVSDFVWKARHQVYRKTGKWPSIYEVETRTKDRIRKKMKEICGFTDYGMVSDERWPKVRDILIAEAKSYVDRRFEKMKP